MGIYVYINHFTPSNAIIPLRSKVKENEKTLEVTGNRIRNKKDKPSTLDRKGCESYLQTRFKYLFIKSF